MILCDLPYQVKSLKWDKLIPFDLLWKQYERVIKDDGAIVLTATQPFASALVMSNPKIFRYEWIWQKTRHTNFLNLKKNPAKKHENILVFYKKLCTYNPQMEKGEPYIDNRKTKIRNQSAVVTGDALSFGKVNEGWRYPSSIQKFANPNNKSLHQTQKPVELFEFLIRTYTNDGAGETILDNCIGSGTTAIAH